MTWQATGWKKRHYNASSIDSAVHPSPRATSTHLPFDKYVGAVSNRPCHAIRTAGATIPPLPLRSQTETHPEASGGYADPSLSLRVTLFHSNQNRQPLSWLLVLALLLLMAGCQNGMEDQPKYEPYEPSEFFQDGTSSRPLPPNTVARGMVMTDTHLYEGRVEGAPAQEFPFALTSEVLARGQERYNIFCAPCHGYSGHGDGMIVQRGFTPPPSLHEERLLNAPHGHFFNVITNGIGTMYSYSDRVQPEDRWAIIAYIRVLQLSQNAELEDLPEDVRTQLENVSE